VTRIAASRSASTSSRIAAASLRGTGCPNGQAATSFGRATGTPTCYGIAVGSFADPNFPPPTSSGWEEAMHPWLEVATATEHFPQGRLLTCRRGTRLDPPCTGEGRNRAQRSGQQMGRPPRLTGPRKPRRGDGGRKAQRLRDSPGATMSAAARFHGYGAGTLGELKCTISVGILS
jgi:hypothetical protein